MNLCRRSTRTGSDRRVGQVLAQRGAFAELADEVVHDGAQVAVRGIRYRQLADGEFNHTSALVLLDADGRVAARTEIIGSKPDPAFVAAVRKAVGP